MFLSTSFPRTQGKPMYLCHAKNHQKSSLFLHKTKYFQAMFLNNSRQQPNYGGTRRADWGCWQGRFGLCRFSGHLQSDLFSINLLLLGMNVCCQSPYQLTTATCMELNLTLTGTGPSATFTNFLYRSPHNVATAVSNSGKLSTQLFSWQTWPNQSGY